MSQKNCKCMECCDTKIKRTRTKRTRRTRSKKNFGLMPGLSQASQAISRYMHKDDIPGYVSKSVKQILSDSSLSDITKLNKIYKTIKTYIPEEEQGSLGQEKPSILFNSNRMQDLDNLLTVMSRLSQIDINVLNKLAHSIPGTGPTMPTMPMIPREPNVEDIEYKLFQIKKGLMETDKELQKKRDLLMRNKELLEAQIKSIQDVENIIIPPTTTAGPAQKKDLLKELLDYQRAKYILSFGPHKGRKRMRSRRMGRGRTKKSRSKRFGRQAQPAWSFVEDCYNNVSMGRSCQSC